MRLRALLRLAHTPCMSGGCRGPHAIPFHSLKLPIQSTRPDASQLASRAMPARGETPNTSHWRWR
eukprot:15485685-Alexandrium_andersonii.AAC.1